MKKQQSVFFLIFYKGKKNIFYGTLLHFTSVLQPFWHGLGQKNKQEVVNLLRVPGVRRISIPPPPLPNKIISKQQY